MNNIKYLKKLNRDEIKELLVAVDFEKPMGNTVINYPVYRELGDVKFNFRFCENDESLDIGEVLKITQEFNDVRIINQEVVVGDRSYISMIMNDFDIFNHTIGTPLDMHKPNVQTIRGLYRFMYKKFGEQYKMDFLDYFTKSANKQIKQLKKELNSQRNVAINEFEYCDSLEKTL